MFAGWAMRPGFRFVFVIFYFTAVLISIVYLRSASDRNFYKLCMLQVEEGRLKRQLTSKQLQLESLISPAAISRRLNTTTEN